MSFPCLASTALLISMLAVKTTAGGSMRLAILVLLSGLAAVAYVGLVFVFRKDDYLRFKAALAGGWK